jgi:hypothetical protein
LYRSIGPWLYSEWHSESHIVNILHTNIIHSRIHSLQVQMLLYNWKKLCATLGYAVIFSSFPQHSKPLSLKHSTAWLFTSLRKW